MFAMLNRALKYPAHSPLRLLFFNYYLFILSLCPLFFHVVWESYSSFSLLIVNWTTTMLWMLMIAARKSVTSGTGWERLLRRGERPWRWVSRPPVGMTPPNRGSLTNSLLFILFFCGTMCINQNRLSVDFPGAPVAKMLCSQCRGPRFDPWSGN